MSSEGDSSDSSADEDPLVTRRVPRWLYQTVKDSGFSSVPSSSTSGGPRRSTRSRQAVEDNNFVNFALMSDILDTPPEPSSVEEALASPFGLQPCRLNFLPSSATALGLWCRGLPNARLLVSVGSSNPSTMQMVP